MSGVEEREGLQVVPSVWSDPRVLGLVALGSDEAGRIGRPKGAHCPGVSEQGVVNGSWHQPVAQGLVEKCGLGQLQAVRDFEGRELGLLSGSWKKGSGGVCEKLGLVASARKRGGLVGSGG